MKLNWLGDYRELIEKIIKYGNAYARTYKKEHSYGTECTLSAAELQTLEYILENEEYHFNMVEIATRLGVLRSAFSKNIQQMIDKGLLEKYHTEDNKKDVIIQASAFGRKVYNDYCKYIESSFKVIFSMLEGIPKEHLDKLSAVLDYLAQTVIDEPEEKPKKVKLVKIE